MADEEGRRLSCGPSSTSSRHRTSASSSPAQRIPITPDFVRRIQDEELAKIRDAVGDERFTTGKYTEARELFEQVALADDFEEFLTIPAYARLG